MADIRLTLTDKTIGGLPHAKEGQYFARDTELPGFAVLIGKRRKTFVVQGDFRKDGQRTSIRIKLVEVGDWTTQKARSHAKALLGQIAKGADPRPKNANAEDAQQGVACPTLRQAWDRYRDAHLLRKGRSEGTTENYRDHVERLMSDWLDQPLSVLGHDPALVATHHAPSSASSDSSGRMAARASRPPADERWRSARAPTPRSNDPDEQPRSPATSASPRTGADGPTIAQANIRRLAYFQLNSPGIIAGTAGIDNQAKRQFRRFAQAPNWLPGSLADRC
jgi:hypothetical protein